MAFTVIPGTFHVVGYSPDGDSIRFQADDPSDWNKLEGPPVKLNAKQHAQLRFEAIDTLEIHYSGSHHQPLALAMEARDFLLEKLGIESIGWDGKNAKVLEAKDGTQGYIIAKTVEKNRRPVSFVFSGPAPKTLKKELFLEAKQLKNCINLALIKEGLAYPTFYSGLFHDIRKPFIDSTLAARTGNIGIWKADVTNRGFKHPALAELEQDLVILPKLFRRLVEFLTKNPEGLKLEEFLRKKNEKVMLIDKQHFTHFDNVIDISKSRIRLKEAPENIVFLE